MSDDVPSKIKLNKQSRTLEIQFGSDVYHLSFEFLRVFSPSAEVRGHGKGQEVLQLNKHNVCVAELIPQGHYALKITFDDGHDSGIYTWQYLKELGENQTQKWMQYKKRVADHQNQQTTVKWV